MPNLSVEISRFVDDAQPGFVECIFVDAYGDIHTVVEKIPIVTDENLWSDSTYPRGGSIRCEVEEEWIDELNRHCVRVSTASPDGVKSTGGEEEFVVLATQIGSK
jgi:hypothetical protein